MTTLEKQSALPELEIPLILSPTGIQNFLDCPRKYYYKHLLRLPEPEDTARPMTLGLLIHSLMEAFNNGVPEKSHTAQRLRALAETLFQWPLDRNALQKGKEPSGKEDKNDRERFSEWTLDRLEALDTVTRDDLARRVRASLLDLERKGYFDRPVLSVLAEKNLEGAIPGIQGCTFKAKLDALIERSPGQVEIVDYKFYGSTAFDQKKPETREAHLTHVLSPINPEAATHAERFPTAGKSRLYQLPLYYLLTQEDPAFCGKVTALTLQILRPAFPDDPNQGAIAVSFPLAQLEENRDAFLADLQRWIVDPIRQAMASDSMSFETNPGRPCKTCAYRWVCEVGGDAESDAGDVSA